MSQIGLVMRPMAVRDHRAAKWAVLGSLAFLLSILLLIAAYFASWATKTNDYVGSGHGKVAITITDGESLRAIGKSLEKAGVIKSYRLFVDTAMGDPRSATIAPGRYQMAYQMSSIAALSRLFDPTARVVSVVLIPEGKRLQDVLKLAASGTGLSLSSLQGALSANLGLPTYANGNAEGFLFPAKYAVPPGTPPNVLLGYMVARFQQEASAIDLTAAAAKAGISPYEAVVVASLLEAEAYPKDYAKVARVIYNRLGRGMRLQLDSTVNYALGTSLINLTPAQRAVKSPYNTFLHGGLPPTPIDSPGRAALLAALNPASGQWLYFVADPKTHITHFATTAAEFQSLLSKYGGK